VGNFFLKKSQKRFDLLRLGHLCSSEVIEHWVRDAGDKGLADNNTERGKSVTKGKELTLQRLAQIGFINERKPNCK